ncbi:MAG: DEAD/DEAH box helicase, partial [Planctomycetes bacterium]|nr:DEAD/DEAH box helicase [Planctomycetota bacterium]
KRIEVLILDEADRMLDMGFIHDIRKIIRMVPKKRQTLFFSATYTKEIKALSDTILYRPKVVEVARQNAAAENVDQSVFRVPKSRKCELLSHLILEGDWNQVLVFTRTKHGANRLAKQLGKNGIMAAAIHGNKSQAARTLALADFKACKVRVLVATDIASRGLDIDRLPHVVNYDMPNIAEDYVHRIGRTGRAGSSGEAISLVTNDEAELLHNIERLLKKVIPVNHIEGFSGPPQVPDKDKAAGVEAHRRRSRSGSNKGAFRGGKPHETKGNSGGRGRRRSPKR